MARKKPKMPPSLALDPKWEIRCEAVSENIDGVGRRELLSHVAYLGRDQMASFVHKHHAELFVSAVQGESK